MRDNEKISAIDVIPDRGIEGMVNFIYDRMPESLKKDSVDKTMTVLDYILVNQSKDFAR